MSRVFRAARHSYLCEPTYRYTRDGQRPHRPSIRDVLVELVDTVDFVRKPRRKLNAVLFAAHLATFACMILFVTRYLSVGTAAFWGASVLFFCTVPHSVWYHRYCSHRAFRFSSLRFARGFLWLNPLYAMEEHYAIAQVQHHQYTEAVGDPYGPHIGWLGTYLAIDSIQKLNVDISPQRYERLKRSVAHIGFPMNDYESFRRTGTVERLGHYVARTLFSQLAWGSVVFAIGGLPGLVTWYAAVFTLWAFLRDFGWRAHRGTQKRPGWEFDRRSNATNRRFFGYLASEWHDNHHLYPRSANCALLPGQFDLAFQCVRLMKRAGIVASYVDARPRFHAGRRTLSHPPARLARESP
jgi:stearoyl-CoA desaturase (delta-9 desaturase)